MGWRIAAEAQRVETGDGARAHGEHVPQDAAHAGGRALVGLDEGRVVVALDLEHHGEAVADVHDAGVLARAVDDAGAFGGKLFQVLARALVAAVLRPHDREDAQLGEVRRASQKALDLGVLAVGQAVGVDHLWGDGRGVGVRCVAHVAAWYDSSRIPS